MEQHDPTTTQRIGGETAVHGTTSTAGAPIIPAAPAQAAPVAPNVVIVQQQPSSGLSTASLVLGLISLGFGLLFFLPVTGLILGIAGLRREPLGRGLAIAGIVMNGLCVAVWALIALAIGGLFAAAAGATAISGY